MLPGMNPAKSEACAAAGRAGGRRRRHDDAASRLDSCALANRRSSRVEVRPDHEGMRRRRLLPHHRGPDEAEVVEFVLLQRHVVARCSHDVGHVVGRGLVAGLPRIAGRMAVGARIGVRNLLELDHMGPEVVLSDAVDQLLRRVVDAVRACRRVGIGGRGCGIGTRGDKGEARGDRHRCGCGQRESPSSTSSVSWAHLDAPLLTEKPAGIVVDEAFRCSQTSLVPANRHGPSCARLTRSRIRLGTPLSAEVEIAGFLVPVTVQLSDNRRAKRRTAVDVPRRPRAWRDLRLRERASRRRAQRAPDARPRRSRHSGVLEWNT